MNMLKSSGEHA